MFDRSRKSDGKLSTKKAGFPALLREIRERTVLRKTISQ